MDININEFLFQLGIGSKETVYMSISPTIGLEIIKVDPVTKVVTSYANRALEYNESMREIADYEEFKSIIREMFAELHINPHCNIVLNLPMVLFGSKELPLILSDESINEVLISEAEQTYTFKRHDPLIAWMDSNSKNVGENRRVFYSALQKDVVENIKTALAELGATLIGVRTSLSSTINALYFSGATAEQMQEGVAWNLLIVGLGGYSICSMLGTKLVDYYEEPLALKSFDSSEIYNAISSSVQLSLMNYPANYTYIVSDTDLVSAEILASRMSGVGSVTGFLENNFYRKENFIQASLEILPEVAAGISLEAVGVAVSNLPDLPMSLEFMSNYTSYSAVDDGEPVKIRIGEKEFEITPQAAVRIVFIVLSILLVPVIIMLLILPVTNNKMQIKLDELNTQSQKLEEDVKKYSDEEAQLDSFNVKREIQDTLKNNRTKLMAYSALGESVPKGLWITYFMTFKDSKIDIKGASTNVEDVYTFYRNLKDSLINSKLRLYRLEMATGDIDEAVENAQQSYIFEITNMSENELVELANAAQDNPAQQGKGAKAVTPSTSAANSPKSGAKTNSTTNNAPDFDKPLVKQEESSVPKTLPLGLK